MNDRNVNQDAINFAKALSAFPPEVSLGVGIVIPNFVNGCSWGFVSDTNTVYKDYIERINKNPNMSSIKINGGYLLTMNMDYLLGVLSKTVKGSYITNRDLDIASKHRQKALEELDKFLRKGIKGKQRVGIYSLNDCARVTVKGVNFPAFCVTMPDLMALCLKYGYGFVLGGQIRSVNQVSSHIMKVVERLDIAPSRNALFVDIAKM